MQGSFYTLHYVTANEAEAKDIFDTVLKQGEQVFKDFFGIMRPDENIDICLYLNPRLGLADVGFSNIVSNSTQVTIHHLGQTAQPRSCCTLAGFNFDRDYHLKVIQHEFLTAAMRQIAKGAGYNIWSQPSWFGNGWQEKLALDHTTEKNRTDVRAKYIDLIKSNPKSVRLGFGIENPYVGGSIFHDFFEEKYGKDAAIRVTKSHKPDFWSAFEEVAGKDWFVVSNEFGAWLEKKTGLPKGTFSIDLNIVSANTALQKAIAEKQALEARLIDLEKRLAESEANLKSLQARNRELEPAAGGQVNLHMKVDDPNYTLNGVSKTMSTPPIIIDGTTLVPIRLISEVFGAKVVWDGASRTITIIKP